MARAHVHTRMHVARGSWLPRGACLLSRWAHSRAAETGACRRPVARRACAYACPYACHVQENIKNCVVIIYDPSRTRTTGLALRAFRLTDTFMALYKVNEARP